MLGSGDSGHIVKLRGLPFSTTVEDILDFLIGVNVCNGKEGVHLTEVRPGRPSGECFIEVESAADVDAALKRDKENMGKRYIEVFATDRQDMEWALNAMTPSANGNDAMSHWTDNMGVVKIRGLPYGCNKDDVMKFFEGLEVGPEGVHLLSDNNGRASGEAFVQFPDQEAAGEALIKDREKIGHRYIEVFKSSADEARSWTPRFEGPSKFPLGRGYGRPTPYDRNNSWVSGGRFPRGKGYGRDLGFGGGRGGLGGGFRGGRGSGNFIVHMRGLPFKATQQDIAYFFKPIRPVNINILYENSGRPSGEADVEFECHEDAMRFFKPIRPVNINILYENSGRPSGEADVEFECHEDAMRAMRRDKSNMDRRYIELFMNSAPSSGNGGGFKPRNFRN